MIMKVYEIGKIRGIVQCIMLQREFLNIKTTSISKLLDSLQEKLELIQTMIKDSQP